MTFMLWTHKQLGCKQDEWATDVLCQMCVVWKDTIKIDQFTSAIDQAWDRLQLTSYVCRLSTSVHSSVCGLAMDPVKAALSFTFSPQLASQTSHGSRLAPGRYMTVFHDDTSDCLTRHAIIISSVVRAAGLCCTPLFATGSPGCHRCSSSHSLNSSLWSLSIFPCFR